MSSQIQKKISVPCEKLLQKDKVKKRKSKLFSSKENQVSSKGSTKIYSDIIRGNIFDQLSQTSQISFCENQYTDSFTNLSFMEEDLCKDKKKIYKEDIESSLLNNVLNDLETEGDDYQCRSQPIVANLLSVLRTKQKKLDFSQRFTQEMGTPNEGWEFFQSKRSKI